MPTAITAWARWKSRPTANPIGIAALRRRSWKSSRAATIRTSGCWRKSGAGLNRPFSARGCQPWRFSAVSDGPKSFYLLLIYDHWIADSVAARLVVQQVFCRYFGLGERRESRPLDLYPGTYRKMFSRRLGPLRLAAAATRLLCNVIRNLGARQVAYSSVTQMAVNFEQFATAPGTVSRFANSPGRPGPR